MLDIQWQYIFDPVLAWNSLPYVLKGLGYTLGISVTSMTIGLAIGFLLAIMRMSERKLASIIARIYISFMRGTPLLVLLFILYFGFPFIGIQFSAVNAAIIGFSLSSSAYIAEILRSALISVDKGQWEAAYALGLKWPVVMRKIIIPQAMRIAVPPLSNVLLDLIKGTALAAMITVPEIFQQAKIVGGREFDYMTMYILVALVYWAICSIFALFQDVLEKRMAVYTN
ncbi:amino acid ABC transporter membrane protein, PAAT family [Carnobacterium iners]|uniref:Amino acid ABC transporter membrane protein, PAAT family n=1 Tax=Carnobacterium iners TaxID=1073423 RepID=A0A1X7N3S0_9LACT|nr:amino acid ABC transporter permease [Carnobacterium iners]SEK97039.1 amino acid ABC transporter membrane protein, PAAT family [Carnobacterium iners]SMH31351.1 amino acid ABC transporter membrane protein, PAAT family [Carnobacterium iners]